LWRAYGACKACGGWGASGELVELAKVLELGELVELVEVLELGELVARNIKRSLCLEGKCFFSCFFSCF
jgi:hypothetical protein